MKTILAAVCGSVCLLSVSAARADITICNNHSSRVFVALGLLGLDCEERFGTTNMVGWYSVSPGQCVSPFVGCYPSNALEFHAEATDGTRWAGSGDVVTLSNEAFEFCAHTNPLQGCPNNRCAPLDHGRAGFSYLFPGGCGLFGLDGYEMTIDLN